MQGMPNLANQIPRRNLHIQKLTNQKVAAPKEANQIPGNKL